MKTSTTKKQTKHATRGLNALHSVEIDEIERVYLLDQMKAIKSSIETLTAKSEGKLTLDKLPSAINAEYQIAKSLVIKLDI